MFYISVSPHIPPYGSVVLFLCVTPQSLVKGDTVSNCINSVAQNTRELIYKCIFNFENEKYFKIYVLHPYPQEILIKF